MRPNAQRAKLAINSLIAIMISMVVTTIATYLYIYTISNLMMNFNDINSIQAYQDKLLTYSIILGVVALIQIGVYITCVVLFIMWFRRAYFNLHRLIGSSRLKYTEGWAAGSWFIPIFSLFGPFQIATDLFTHSENLLVEKGLMDRKPAYHQVKGWWWGLWIAAIVFERVSTYLDDKAELATSTAAGVISLVLFIGAGILAIQMIKNYSQMEKLLKTIDLEDSVGAPQITNDDLLDSGI